MPPILTIWQYRYVPWAEETSDIKSCGIPIPYHASDEWANKKVVLVSVPGKKHTYHYLEGSLDH
jgi:hypothetical protein